MTCICLRTLKRWRREFIADGNGVDRCKGSNRKVAHRLSVEEGQRNLLTCNEPKCTSLTPGQIVPDLVEQSIFNSLEEDYVNDSECRFYRSLHAHGQLHRHAGGPDQVWSWDISYLPISVKGIWLYLVVDMWSKVNRLN